VFAAPWREQFAELTGGHAVGDNFTSHLEAAVDWLVRAQDATPSGGIARGYSLVWNPYFRQRGWEPEYPETTGYIIPTLLAASTRLQRPDLAARAVRAAEWESALQLDNGAVQGGVVGQPVHPAVFNTGQVMFGWLAAHAVLERGLFADSAIRAAHFLVAHLDHDGIWRRGESPFVASGQAMYNARTAWALAETGIRLGVPSAIRSAHLALNAVAQCQHENGWIPGCCLNDAEHPLVHTLAYAVRGLLEGGRVLEDERLIAAACRAATAMAEAQRPDGALPGRLDRDWAASASWSCLTGNAQMASVWLRLADLTGDSSWIQPAERAIRFVASTQNRASGDPGLRGGIKGSAPIGGGYGRYEILSWATKFFVDAILRYERANHDCLPRPQVADVLA
jgi:hypothetical protein